MGQRALHPRGQDGPFGRGEPGQVGDRRRERDRDRAGARVRHRGDPGEEVTRDVAKATGLAERGVRVRSGPVRSGEFTDPASLEHAFEGAATVLMVSAAVRGPGAVAANLAALVAA